MNIGTFKVTDLNNITFNLTNNSFNVNLLGTLNGDNNKITLSLSNSRKLYKLVSQFDRIKDRFILRIDNNSIIELNIYTDVLILKSGTYYKEKGKLTLQSVRDYKVYLKGITIHSNGVKTYNTNIEHKETGENITVELHEDEFYLIVFLLDCVNIYLRNYSNGNFTVVTRDGFDSVKIVDRSLKADKSLVFSDNINFYPTPMELCGMLLNNGSNLNLLRQLKYSNEVSNSNIRILEPSAGSGNIVDYLVKLLGEDIKIKIDCIDCIEKDDRLREMLDSKGYNVVSNDYLTFNGNTRYNIIVANPPFSDGSKHLLKMLKYLKANGGLLYCIIGSHILERENNRYVDEINTLIGEAKDKFIDVVDNAFANAERKTNVRVTLLRLSYEANVGELEDLDLYKRGLSKALDNLNISSNNSSITSLVKQGDFVDNIILKYNIELECFKDFYQSYTSLHKVAESTEKEFKYADILFKHYLKLPMDYNVYLQYIREKYWKILFNSSNISLQFPSRVLDLIKDKVSEFSNYDFTKENIRKILKNIISNIGSTLDKVIEDVFDACTRDYCYLGEQDIKKLYYSAWKTNKGYIIGKKVIIGYNSSSINPFGVSEYGYSTKDILSKYNVKLIEELLVVIQVLKYDNINNIDYTELRNKIDTVLSEGFSKGLTEFEFGEFSVRGYKKGTMHILFKDKEFLDLFNVTVGRLKNWLPSSFGNTTREDMATEDRKVVESFNQVMNNTNKSKIDYSNNTKLNSQVLKYRSSNLKLLG